MTHGPASIDLREFALQLAAVAERLDERSARAVARVEAASAVLECEAAAAAAAARALASEREQAATAPRPRVQPGARLVWIASAAVLAGALVAVAGAALAVASAKRELASITRDQVLLEAIGAADVTLCGERLCARVERPDGPDEAAEYRPVAPR